MSYSFDTDGWDLFTTPFSSTPTRTASASSTQQAERPRQKPSEASPHNTTPPAAQRNPLPTQKAAPPVRQTADTQQKQIDEQKAPTATASASDENPALESSAPSPAQAQPDIAKQEQADPPKTPVPAQADSAKQEQAAPTKAPAPASTPPVAPQKELVLDMSSGSGAGAAPAPVQDDTERRKAHEASEAKRRAEWEAKQTAKKQAEEASIQKLNDMSDADAIAVAVKRISTDVERITRRNMKECVADHIQELCRKDTEFARKTMHPRKSMVKCFKYINRMAKEYVRQEMEDNDIQPDGGGYGCDVPDGLVYQFAEDYFNAIDAPEDKEKEEMFVPKPYTGTTTKTATKPAKKAEKKPKKQQDTPSDSYEQISLEGVM